MMAAKATKQPKKTGVTAETLEEARKLSALWERRSEPKLTQEEFGKKFKIGNQSAVGQFLRGVKPLSMKAASGFAKGLERPIADFSPRLVAEAEKNAALASNFVSNADDAGAPRVIRRTPVRGQAKMGENGYYEEYPPEQDDGWVDGYSADPDAYALRVNGDSMFPAIRHGSFVVVEPNGTCTPGEYVAIALKDGQKMVKELIIERPNEVVIESVNNHERKTLARSMIETMHPVAAVVAASKWRPA